MTHLNIFIVDNRGLRYIWKGGVFPGRVLVAFEGETPLRIRRFLRSPGPQTRALVLLASEFSDATLFAIQLAWEIGRLVHLGRNYVNPRTRWEKLSRRYPKWRKCFVPNPLDKVWATMPPRRDVPRVRLDYLLEWVRSGREGTEGDDEFQAPEASGRENGYFNDEDVGGAWRPLKKAPPAESVPEPPILPEFESLWNYVERCARLPAFLIIDSIDALAAHYGIKESELVDALQKDLVDTGYASVLFIYTRPERPAWLSSMDGALRWTPLRSASRLPHWVLTVEYLVGRVLRPRRHVMRFEGGRLVSCASDDEIVRMLERTTWRSRVKTIPAEIIDFLANQVDARADSQY